MTTDTIRQLELGDLITFRAGFRFKPTREVVRKVNGFVHGYPTVRFNNFARFVVKPSEIVAVQKEAHA